MKEKASKLDWSIGDLTFVNEDWVNLLDKVERIIAGNVPSTRRKTEKKLGSVDYPGN